MCWLIFFVGFNVGEHECLTLGANLAQMIWLSFCDVISSIVLRVAPFADTLSCPTQKNKMEFAPSYPLPKGEKICRRCGWLFDEVMGACAWSKFTAPKVVQLGGDKKGGGKVQHPPVFEGRSWKRFVFLFVNLDLECFFVQFLSLDWFLTPVFCHTWFSDIFSVKHVDGNASFFTGCLVALGES